MKRLIALLVCCVAVCFTATGCKFNTGGSGSGTWNPFGGQKEQSPDGEYSILLYTGTHPDYHTQQAKKAVEQTKKMTGWDNVFAIGYSEYSSVYYGRFVTRDAAQAQIAKVRNFKYKGQFMYPRAIVTNLPGKSVGPDEWNIEKTTTGYYSALIAVFYDMPQRNYIGRKQFAVKYCKRLREAGYDAYFFHGPTKSGVCIGLFPYSAISYVKKEVRHGNQQRAQEITVARYNDPKLQKILEEDFPNMQVNGNTERSMVPTYNHKSGKYERMLKTTYAFKVPGRANVESLTPSRPSRRGSLPGF